MENNNIGALWIKEGTKGEFYKGNIVLDNGEKINIVVFKNNYKNKETQPDYQILKAKSNNEEQKYIQEERQAIQNEENYEISDLDDYLPF